MAVTVAFVANGLCFATLFSRLPDLRASLGLDNSSLGLLLLAAAGGSMLALPSAGALIRRTSAAAVVRAGAMTVAAGVVVVALAADFLGQAAAVAVGLFAYGIGTGSWDVAMNVEGAAVEHRLRRSVMPRFHAFFSIGTVAGAGLGVLMVAVDVPLTGHLGLAALSALAMVPMTRSFLPVEPEQHAAGSAAGAWREPRTLLVGLMVLAFALTEGAANDWLALALIDGYDAPRWLGVAGFAAFVVAMTGGRLLGTAVLDRWGRVPVLRATAVLALLGLLLLLLGPHPVLVALGVVLWGLGASLGFPVGMSAGADDPAHAAARVSVVSTIGYGAFLAGPPLLGFLGDAVGTLESLWLVAAVLVPTTLLVSVARQPERAPV
ncbi:MFS transporter [Nocardioides coralli]|nr:MFS transporter [Nocardioides coralli]